MIRWNLVLEATIEVIGGTKPTYLCERIDGLIEVAGMKCLEAWEAESTAAAHALYQLGRGTSHVKNQGY